MRSSRYFSLRSRIVAISAVLGVCSVYGAQTVLAAPPPAPSGSVRLIVQTKTGLTIADQHGVIARSGGTLLRDVHGVHAHVVDVPAGLAAAMLKRYQSDPSVSHAELDQPRHISGAASDPGYGDQWALPQIGWDTVHGNVSPAGSATIAVLDTGVDGSNPDLSGELVPGWSAFGTDPTVDPNGHGTWVASIAAASTDNDSGIAGVAYAGAKVMPVQVIGADGTGQDSDIVSGITWAADNGADVILMAFSNPGFSQALQDAVNYAWSKGAVVVAATGNDGSSTVSYPAGDASVVGVSATDSTDALWSGSNYGADTFLAAPGVSIPADAVGGGTTSVTGTSASAAMVAGAAALLKADDSSATNDVIVGRLARNADAAGTSDQTGNGRLNLARAVSDTSTVGVTPAGAPPTGAGGPLVGPYTLAAKNLTITFAASTGTGTVSLSDTTDPSRNQTCSGTCTISLGNNDVGTLTAAPGSGSFLDAWLAPSTGITSCTTSSPQTCSFSMANATQSVTVKFDKPAISANPTSGVPGQSVTVAGTGFRAAQTISLTFNGAAVTSPGCSASTSGAFSCSFVVTGAAALGTATIQASDGVRNASASFTVLRTASVSISCSPNPVTPGASAACTTTVQDQTTGGKITPTGTVTVTSSGAGTFTPASGLCTLSAVNGNMANCQVSYVQPAAGTPTLTATYAAATGSGFAGNSGTTLLTVSAATGLAVASASGTFGGAAALSATLTAGGSPVSGKSVSFSLNGNSVGSATTNASGVASVPAASLSGINAGSYPTGVSASFAGDSSFNGSSGSAALTVTARPVTITADAKTKVYGNADPTLTFQVTSGSLVGSDAFTGSLTRAAGEDVGNYAILQGTVGLSSNYVLSYVGANLSLTARPVTITADAKTKVYGDADPALTFQVTSGSLVGSDSFTGSLTRAAGEHVGSYAIQQGTVGLGSNYSLTYVGATLSVTARAVTVTVDAQSKVYGDADPALTYQITSGHLVGTDAFSGGLTRAAGQDVNDYAISQGTLALSSNYTLTVIPANFAITARPVTITADAKAKAYGDDDPALTYQITHGSLAFSDAFAGSLTRDAGENVGTYAIRQGSVALSSNYNLTYVGADLTISQRAITVTADPQTKVYGDADPALSWKITAGSLKSGDSISGDLARVPGNNVGSYAITQGTLTAGGNYAINYVGDNLTITKRPITVTAADKTKVYGDTDPALTQSITSGNLAYSDLLSGSLMRVAGEHVGSYAINQGTLTAGNNYTLTFVPGHLTITQRPLTVTAADKTKVYGNADPTLTSSITSGSLVGSDAFTGALTRQAGEHVGSYEIRQGTLALSGDYDLSFVVGHLTITQRSVAVAADPHTKVYGDADPALTYHITAGSLAFSDSFAGVLSRAAGENVGSYAIGQNTLSLGSDYALTFTGSTLTITKRSVQVAADNKSKPWGASDPALTYTITSGSLAFSDAFGGGLVRDPGEDGGTYAIKQGTLALSGNYTLSFTNGTFTITPSLNLKGFYQPVTMSGSTLVWNTAKGGSTVPLKFNVFTNQGAELTSTSVVKSLTYQVVTSLGLSGTTDPLDTLATGGTVLRYDGTAGQFVYNWQTPKSANYYRLTVAFVDGSSLVSYFQMK